MKPDFLDFISWLDYRYDKYSNRDIINFIYEMITQKLNILNLKLEKKDFKNHLTAFIYQYSSGSRISNPEQFYNENSDEKDYFDIHFVDEIRELFREINNYIDLYRFNILDVHKNTLELNFIDFIFQNVEIMLPEENDGEESLEETEYDYY